MLQRGPGGQMPQTPSMPPNQNYGPAGFSPLFAAGPGAASGQALTCQAPIPTTTPNHPRKFYYFFMIGIIDAPCNYFRDWSAQDLSDNTFKAALPV